ncbi:MAG: flap endonuclease-1 [Nanoarchaeota archaeon]|nr:flap endonuclease-1 [Nanoarchaeota archaeon]
MGVKISDIVKKKKISFEDLKNKKIAVDFSNAAYQFLSSIRQRDGTPLMDSNGNITSHLLGILSRSTNLLSQGIKIAYVLDGFPPELKVKTQERRHEGKIKAEKNYEEAKEDGNEDLMLKYSKQFIRLTRQMTDESKELIQALGMPVIQAPAEADAQISYLCKKGDVWSASTTDFDTLLHGCPRVITNLTLSQKKKASSGSIIKISPEMIELGEVLNNLKISQEQLISLAILVGTDYNSGIKGIGPKKALKIVAELKTPKNIFLKNPIEDADWEKVFELFTDMEVKKDYKLEWSPPDKEKILKILVDKKEFSEERVMSTLNKLIGGNIKVASDQKGLGSWI